MLSISNRMAQNITSNRNEHRFANLFLCVLADGTTYRFTDHNETLFDGTNTFSPAYGFNASAREMQDGLQTNDVEIVGFLSAAGVSLDDIRAGRWRNAAITEKIVDWRYPWAGDYGLRKYSVSDIEWSESQWSANIEGIGRKLRRKIGDTMGRVCRWDFAGTECGVNAASFTDSATVTGVSTTYPRKRLAASTLSAGHPDRYYEYGLVTFTGGDNDGFVGEVHAWDQSSAELILRLPMPYDIEVGDTFDIYPGCGKTIEFCKGTSGDKDRPWTNNIAEFGGFPSIPGIDKLIQYPDAKE